MRLPLLLPLCSGPCFPDVSQRPSRLWKGQQKNILGKEHIFLSCEPHLDLGFAHDPTFDCIIESAYVRRVSLFDLILDNVFNPPHELRHGKRQRVHRVYDFERHSDIDAMEASPVCADIFTSRLLCLTNSTTETSPASSSRHTDGVSLRVLEQNAGASTSPRSHQTRRTKPNQHYGDQARFTASPDWYAPTPPLLDANTFVNDSDGTRHGDDVADGDVRRASKRDANESQTWPSMSVNRQVNCDMSSASEVPSWGAAWVDVT